MINIVISLRELEEVRGSYRKLDNIRESQNILRKLEEVKLN